MRQWKIFLIGWGSIKEGETDFIEKQILESTGKKNINILMINFANSLWNDTNYLDKFKAAYSKYSEYIIHFRQIFFNEIISESIINNKIDWSDIIYFGWWNTVQLKNNFPEKIFQKIIYAYDNNKKILAGRSAGALIFFKKFLSKQSDSIGLFDWFGFFDEILMVHFSEYWEQKELKKYVQQTQIDGIWMDECTALIIDDGEWKVIKQDQKNIYKYSFGSDNSVFISIM